MAEHDYEQLVRDFCAAWAAADFDLVVSYFAPDGVYHNIPRNDPFARQYGRNPGRTSG